MVFHRFRLGHLRHATRPKSKVYENLYGCEFINFNLLYPARLRKCISMMELLFNKIVLAFGRVIGLVELLRLVVCLDL